MKVLEVSAFDGKIEVSREFLNFDKKNKPDYLNKLKANFKVIFSASLSFDLFWNKVLGEFPAIYDFDLL